MTSPEAWKAKSDHLTDRMLDHALLHLTLTEGATTMNNPADLTADRPQTFTTKADVVAEITQAIENGDARAEEYDLDAIADECFTYDPAAGHIQHAGYHQTATVEEFWQSVERHAINEE